MRIRDLIITFGFVALATACASYISAEAQPMKDVPDAQWAADAVERFKGTDRPKEVRHPEAFSCLKN